jgi:hypothetical protein
VRLVGQDLAQDDTVRQLRVGQRRFTGRTAAVLAPPRRDGVGGRQDCDSNRARLQGATPLAGAPAARRAPGPDMVRLADTFPTFPPSFRPG